MPLELTEVWATYRAVGTYDRPFHMANAWRGAFGWSLRCVSPRAYAALYETKVPSPSPLEGDLAPGTDCPRPLVPLLPAPGRGVLERGERLQVGLRFFGDGWERHQGAVLDGLADVASRLRSRPGPDTGAGPNFALDEVNVGPPGQLRWRITAPDRLQGHLRVELVTPTRLRIKGEPDGRPSFSRLARLAHGRLRALEALYGDGAGTPISEDVWQVADQVALRAPRSRELRWEAPADHGNAWRPMRGRVGSWGYEGPVLPFMELMAAAGRVHVGSDTMYGLGRVEVSLVYPGEPD
jgi:hypothetical protein